MPWYNNLICYYTPSDTTISRHYIPTDTANYHTPIHWYNSPLRNSTPLLTMNTATARPLLEDPCGCAHQERLGGRHTTSPRPQTLRYYIVFPVFAICVIRYLHRRRPISREDAHLMYPRYPRVFFLYVMIYCPLPHQSLWERLGVSLLCTCVAFSPLC